jgi:hypothetical protein
MASLEWMLAAALAWGTTQADNPHDGFEVSAQVAAERATKCGLGAVTFRFDDELQSSVFAVANEATPTDSQLACLDVATGWHLIELPPEVESRFLAIRNARAKEILRRHSSKWLAARGLLERVPKYVAGVTDDGAFTREVETLCGPEAHGAFQSQYGYHVLSPDWPPALNEEPPEAFSCLMHVTLFAGYEIGFIGNEVREPAN